MRGLAGKVAIVTGATRTMGEAIAARLASEGVMVVGFSRSADDGEAVAARIRATGGHASFVAGDMTKQDDITAVVEFARSTYGRLDIVVNNAAAVELVRNGSESKIADEALEDFDHQLKVGLYGPFLLARAAIPVMLAGGGGAFVSISSQGGRMAFPGMSGYGPTKAALEALDRQIAVDYGASGIRANSVVTGSIRVSQNAHVHDDPTLGGALRDMQMLPSVGLPEHIAAAVAFLASDDAAFITGVSLPVEGGVTAKGPLPEKAFAEWMSNLSVGGTDDSGTAG